MAEVQLNAVDIVVIIAYFVIVMAFGLASSLKNRGSTQGYFLAGRTMHWIPVGASLFASNIGSGHFVGLAGSGAASGIGIAVFELNAIFILLMLGWIFVPVYIASGVFTMPEYIKKRFGGQRIRVYLAMMALLLSIFTKVSADLFAGAVFINQAVGWNIYLAIILLLAVAAIFTITGGLTAVIITDFVQTIIMIIGAFILMVVSMAQVGGYTAITQQYFDAVPNTSVNAAPDYNYTKCGHPPANSLHLIRAADDGSLPWPGIMFGLTISSIWYWCSDQVIVQRALAAKNLSNAKAGTILAGYLKFLPMWLIVVPGMAARILFPDTVGCADPDVCTKVCGQANGCTNIAYATLVIQLLPTGMRGVMLAVMMAALMSSLTSIFNSSATIFTIDIWTRIRKNANDMELMVVGRVFVLFMVGISIVWIPIVQNFAELFHYIQSITSYLAPPVCAIFVLAVAWKRINEHGAFWGLMVGLVVGLVRFGWEFAYTVPPCGEEYKDQRPAIIKDVHYLHFGIILFAVSAIVTIVISLLTKPIPDEHLHRLTFWSRYSQKERLEISEVERQDRPDDTEPSPNEQGHDEELSCPRKSLNWLCGIEKHPEPTQEEKDEFARKSTSLYEERNVRILLNCMAVALMVLAVFVWGFFY